MTILSALGIALVAAAITDASLFHQGRHFSHFNFWTNSEMKVAYACFGGAAYVLLATVYDWPLFGAARRLRRLERVTEQMKKGSTLHDRCMADDDNAALRTAYGQWFKETSQVLRDVAPSFLPEFEMPRAGSAFQYDGISRPNSALASTVEEKLGDLRRVADWLRA